MPDWKHALLSVIDNFEQRYDTAKFRLHQRLGLGKLWIQPYLGHGTQKTLYLKGRVLRDKNISSAMEDDSIWLNLLNMYKRYKSDEIPGALVRARFDDLVEEVTANEEGYFDVELHPSALPEVDDVWYDIELELVDYPGKARNRAEPQEVRATGKVIVPPPDAQFGIISDIDDTVLRTDVLNLIAMARNTFLMNARTRLPFEGVAAFYDALRRGDGERYNPIYYVSSGAWNLYDMIIDFFVVRNIPLGPLFMVDFGITSRQFLMPSHREHKLKIIQMLLDTHPTLPFILIGDSGQKDPEIYLEAISNNPKRILAAYIRDVTLDSRDAEIHLLLDRAKGQGVEMVVVEDTFAAARHAAEKGFITPEKLLEILKERNEDKQAPTPLEAAIRPDTADVQANSQSGNQ
jgi:phosphatidate phosphatase APP1